MNRTDLEAFMQARGYTEDPSPQMKYSDFERELKAIFSQYFAPEWIEEHFLMPKTSKTTSSRSKATYFNLIGRA